MKHYNEVPWVGCLGCPAEGGQVHILPCLVVNQGTSAMYFIFSIMPYILYVEFYMLCSVLSFIEKKKKGWGG